MKRYTVLGLTDTEILQGKLSAIMNAVMEESTRTLQNSRIQNEASKQWAQIYFENNLEQSFYDKYENESDVLYVNDVAMRILIKRGIGLRIINEVMEIPQDSGTALSLPVYS